MFQVSDDWYELPGRPDHALFIYNTLNVHYEYGCCIIHVP